MKLVSWNINGWNACMQKGLLNFVHKEKADVYCFQEIKSSEEKISQGVMGLEGFSRYWNVAEKKGYSGVMILSREKPISVKKGIGVAKFDGEGRVLTAEFEKFYLVNTYFPNSQRGLLRLDYKLEFNKEFAKFCRGLEKKKPVVVTGDLNVCHTELDIANPKQNVKNAGFTPEERSWFDGWLAKGYIDTFRMFEKEGGHYTWWSYRFDARARNIGWRLDYFVVSDALKKKVEKSDILDKVMKSGYK